MEFDHLATNNLQLNNNLILGQNPYQDPQNKVSNSLPFNSQNPFINALASEPLEFNNFYPNQNHFIPNPFIYMENGNNPNVNPLIPLSRGENPVVPNSFKRNFRSNSIHNNQQNEMQDENEGLTCKSNQGKPLPKFEIENKENIQNKESLNIISIDQGNSDIHKLE